MAYKTRYEQQQKPGDGREGVREVAVFNKQTNNNRFWVMIF